jgi:hypothetical protein
MKDEVLKKKTKVSPIKKKTKVSPIPGIEPATTTTTPIANTNALQPHQLPIPTQHKIYSCNLVL